VSGYWRLSLRKGDGGSLYLFHTSNKRVAQDVLRTLIEETGCDRFVAEHEPDNTPEQRRREVPHA
jgi:hypothetical protein